MILAVLNVLLAGSILVDGKEFAVVRPFAIDEEIAALSSTFDAWNNFVPCDGRPAYPVDIIMTYSRTYASSPSAQSVTSRLATEFEGGSQAWHRCFRNFALAEANLTDKEDEYEPLDQENNPNWVSGPNSVFRFVLKTMMKSRYDAFFFMELDSWPVQSFWLDQFLKEATENPGVAIRGSRYRGDKWDEVLLQLPEALLAHLNGNAIYFPKHPLLTWLSEQMENDHDTEKYGVAFDVRMADLVLGARQDATLWGTLSPHGANPYLGDSMLIGNYANTLLNSSFYGGEYIMHLGKKNVFSELKESQVTLAVSHFDDLNYNQFGSSIRTYHPFRQIVILSMDASSSTNANVSTPSGNSQVIWEAKTLKGNMAFCELANLVNTEHFVYTDTYHAIASPVSILMSGKKPVVPYVPVESRFCKEDSRCTSQLQQAEDLFGVKLDRHYDIHTTLFYTDEAKDFCAAWAAAEQALLRKNTDTCLPLTGPSADDYMAWLTKKADSTVADFYAEENREMKGWRQYTLLHTPHPVDPRPCGEYHETQYSWTLANISACSVHVESPANCTADPACTWRPIFNSGKCIANIDLVPDYTVTSTSTGTMTTTVPTTPPPTIAPTPAPTPVPARQILPTETETSTDTSTTSLTLTTTTTTQQGLSVFATVILTLNPNQPLKALLRKIKKAVNKQVAGGSVKLAKVVVTVVVETLQRCGIRFRIKIKLVFVLRAGTKGYCRKRKPDKCRFNRRGRNQLARQRGYQRRLQDASSEDTEFTITMSSEWQRRLQDAAADANADDENVEVDFADVEAFSILNAEEDADSINELKSDSFVPAVTAALADELPGASADDLTPSLSNFTEQARALVSYSVPEEEDGIVADLLTEVQNTSTLVDALASSNDSDAIIGEPVVDECMNRDCNGKGNCTWGICRCVNGWRGVNCGIETALTTEAPKPFSITVALADNWVPVVVSLSIITACLMWVIPCTYIYYRKKKNAEEDNNKKKIEEDNPVKENNVVVEVKPGIDPEEEIAFI